MLPSIHHKIQWLNVESLSMEQRAKHLFTNGNVLSDLFKNQILSLIIRICNNKNQLTSTKDENTIIFTNIFTVFTNLQYLNFDSSSIYSQYISFDISPPIFISSTLLEQHVHVVHFNDCLYLLDGRVNQLRVFRVKSSWIRRSSRLTINNTESLPNMKCSSLYCDTDTVVYDELIVPHFYIEC
ncbi:unnamed protein product [Rotaria sp. Silwood1]|nr:unnamed protein product [Rotaria sp. Silwood1]CAF1636680.1 unnamed protein product [Rotaria sp. Silwood1]